MTEQEWLACDHPGAMFLHLGGSVSRRKARLYAAACCRHAWKEFPQGPYRPAVEVAERLVDGLAGEKERLAALRALREVDAPPLWSAWWAAQCAVARNVPHMLRIDAHVANVVKQHAGNDQELHTEIWLADTATYPNLVRCLFGNPFRPAKIAPRVLGWHGGLLVHLAQRMYDSRGFAEMVVMADMLEDAGCRDAQVLAHCRNPGEHARGCFVIDLILGKS